MGHKNSKDGNLGEDKSKNPDKAQQQIINAVKNSILVESCNLPRDIIQLIVSFHEITPLYFNMVGRYTKLSNNNQTISQTTKSNSAL